MAYRRSVHFGSDIGGAFNGAAAILGAVMLASWLLEAAQFVPATQPLTFFGYLAGVLEGIGAGIWNIFRVEIPPFLAVTTATVFIVIVQLVKGIITKAPTFYDYFVETLSRFPQLSPVLRGQDVLIGHRRPDDLLAVQSTTNWALPFISDGIQTIGDAVIAILTVIIAIVAFLPSLLAGGVFGWLNRETLARAAIFWGLLIAVIGIAFGIAFLLFSMPFMALEGLTEGQRNVAFGIAFLMSAAVWVFPRFIIASGLLAVCAFLVDRALFAADVMPIS